MRQKIKPTYVHSELEKHFQNSEEMVKENKMVMFYMYRGLGKEI